MGRISPCAAKMEEIGALLTQGYTRKQIAATLGLSVHTVQSFLQRRHIPGVPREYRRKKISDERLSQLIAASHTHEHIATTLGVSCSAIHRRSKKMGLQTARTGPRAGLRHPRWKHGRVLGKHGYIEIYVPLHPHCRAIGGRVSEHRLVMEVMLGRYLHPDEVVHHHDNHPSHNWPSNLGLHASNAAHLRAELTARLKATPRSSIPGAYGNNQKIVHCPGIDETLAQCPLEIRQQLAWYIESHHPTTEHRTLPIRSFLRTGAWRNPFREESTG